MDRSAHLARLAEDLSSDPAYATGRRRYLRTVTVADCADLAEALYEQIDGGDRMRTAAARRQGLTVACGLGCNTCCNELILAHGPEVDAVVRWLEQPAHLAVKEAFLASYPVWKAAAGDGAERLSALWAEDFDAYRQAHQAQRRRRVMCAFNHEGACSIYPVRPVVCRTAHALETAAYCGFDDPAGAVPATVESPPFDDFVRRADALIRAFHHAAGRRGEPPLALCDAVHRRLAP